MRVISDEIDGVSNWIWDSEDMFAWSIIKNDWPYLKDKCLYHCKKYNTVIQAGGSCGMYPRLLSNIFNTVYTFEPDATNFYCLVRNCPGSNIIKMQSALGVSRSPISLYNTYRHNVGMFRVKESSGTIPVLEIDSLNLESCDLIFLDVEGYETNVLLGSVKTIKKYSPLLVCEVLSDEDESKILEVITDLGYKEIDRYERNIFYSC